MSSYRQLKVWRASFDIVKEVYRVTSSLPEIEKFGIASQAQQSAVSIPSNIAEGQQRNSSKEFKHFISMSRGSAAELSTQPLLIQDIYKIDCEKLIIKVEEVQKMLYSLSSKL
jgi:four helix bundle protein